MFKVEWHVFMFHFWAGEAGGWVGSLLQWTGELPVLGARRHIWLAYGTMGPEVCCSRIVMLLCCTSRLIEAVSGVRGVGGGGKGRCRPPKVLLHLKVHQLFPATRSLAKCTCTVLSVQYMCRHAACTGTIAANVEAFGT